MISTTTTTNNKTFGGWNASEGILDERLTSIDKLKKISQIIVVQQSNGKYVLKYLGQGNQFSGFPFVMGTVEYSYDEAHDARIQQIEM